MFNDDKLQFALYTVTAVNCPMQNMTNYHSFQGGNDVIGESTCR